MQVMTPSMTRRWPTMTRPISSRSEPNFALNRSDSRSTSRMSVMISLLRLQCLYDASGDDNISRRWHWPVHGPRADSFGLAGTDQLEVAPHVELVTRRDRVLLQDVLGNGAVLCVNLLVASAPEALLGGTEHDLARRGALPGVDRRRRHILGLAI